MRGTFARAGAFYCEPCAAGSFQPTPGQSICRPCPLGYQTDESRTTCTECPPGTKGEFLGAVCEPCPPFTTATASRTSCVIDYALLAGLASFTILTLLIIYFLMYLPGVTRTIADITWSVVDEAVIVTTQSRHHFGSRLLKVHLWDTGVPWLHPSPASPYLYARSLSPTQLQLFMEPKVAVTTPSEASIGKLKPLFMVEAWGTVFLRIPVLIWLAPLTLGLIFVCSLVDIPWWHLILMLVTQHRLIL